MINDMQYCRNWKLFYSFSEFGGKCQILSKFLVTLLFLKQSMTYLVCLVFVCVYKTPRVYPQWPIGPNCLANWLTRHSGGSKLRKGGTDNGLQRQTYKECTHWVLSTLVKKSPGTDFLPIRDFLPITLQYPNPVFLHYVIGHPRSRRDSNTGCNIAIMQDDAPANWIRYWRLNYTTKPCQHTLLDIMLKTLKINA